MFWKPSADVDKEVRGWMKSKGWEVTDTDYHFDQEIYAWRHQLLGGHSPTLRIARYILDHNPAFVLLYHLDRLNVAQLIRRHPGARLVVTQEGTSIVLKEITA
jgi:hypothetical protein